MNIKEYKEAVIALFKSGKATDEQWNEMAEAVLYESELGHTPAIDEEIDPEVIFTEEERP